MTPTPSTKGTEEKKAVKGNSKEYDRGYIDGFFAGVEKEKRRFIPLHKIMTHLFK